MHTHEVNRAAVGDSAKAVCAALDHLGKRCSVRWVNLQCEAPVDVKRVNYYEAFLRWFEALWLARREGAEFLFEDFCARVEALRAGDRHDPTDWYEQLARCEEEHCQAIKAAILNRDMAAIRRELAEDIAAKRRLLAMHEARARSARAA
ncbi:MAG TPA: hypothetical protein VGV59_03405 [Pyrinomonadaceae bacterium]|nr:hypothetical protein [Pyrinomonadaceae bacterium]